MVWQANFKGKPLFLFLFSALLSIFLLPSAASLGSGNPMDLIFTDTEGKKVRLAQMIADGPVLLYFWATWCKPCRKTTPKVNAFAQKYKEQVKVLGINVGGIDSLKDIKKYRSRYKISYRMLVDQDNEAVKAYSVFAIPVIILLDEAGKVRFRDNEPPKDLEKLLSD
jgi:thiol-disulfide isomerase/thioredoxin